MDWAHAGPRRGVCNAHESRNRSRDRVGRNSPAAARSKAPATSARRLCANLGPDDRGPVVTRDRPPDSAYAQNKPRPGLATALVPRVRAQFGGAPCGQLSPVRAGQRPLACARFSGPRRRPDDELGGRRTFQSIVSLRVGALRAAAARLRNDLSRPAAVRPPRPLPSSRARSCIEC